MFIPKMYCFRLPTQFIKISFDGVKSLMFPQYTLIKSIQPRQLIYFSVHNETRIIEQICRGDLQLEENLKKLMRDIETMRHSGLRVPLSLQAKQWQNLMDLPTRNQRRKYLKYIIKTEKSKEKKAKKGVKRKEYKELEEVKEYPDDLQYGLRHQSLFLRTSDTAVNRFDYYRVFQAMIHGKPIVLDCSFEQHMVQGEIINSATQVALVLRDNRRHKEPFHLHMCNVDPNGEFMKQLRITIPTVEERWFPLNIHTDGYLDLFPKEKLVYLTPHCREELTHYDDDAVYVIGCMVDKVNNAKFSLAKAKRDGIKTAKLPLVRYVELAPGAKKTLNIDHMVQIMLDLKLTGDWKYALKHIPRRKLMQTKIQS